jgi:hypothetical protein
MPNIIEDKNFVKNVENYIFRNEKKFAIPIARVRTQIPVQFRASKPLYRGMILDKDFVKGMQMDGTKLVLEEITSWTTDQRIAERFVFDKSKIIRDMPNGVGVIFKQKIPDSKVILDIQGFCFFMDAVGLLDQFGFDDSTKDMGIEEAEVLVDQGITLSRSDIIKVGP